MGRVSWKIVVFDYKNDVNDVKIFWPGRGMNNNNRRCEDQFRYFCKIPDLSGEQGEGLLMVEGHGSGWAGHPGIKWGNPAKKLHKIEEFEKERAFDIYPVKWEKLFQMNQSYQNVYQWGTPQTNSSGHFFIFN